MQIVLTKRAGDISEQMPRIKFDIYLVCKFAIFPQGIFMGCRKLCKFYQWPGAGGQYCVCYRYNHYSNNPFGGQYPLGTTQYPVPSTHWVLPSTTTTMSPWFQQGSLLGWNWVVSTFGVSLHCKFWTTWNRFKCCFFHLFDCQWLWMWCRGSAEAWKNFLFKSWRKKEETGFYLFVRWRSCRQFCGWDRM